MKDESRASSGLFRRDVLLGGVVGIAAAGVAVADLTRDEDDLPASQPGKGGKTMSTIATKDGTEINDNDREGREP